MAFANTSITDIIATTIESRTKKIQDNVTLNNALLARLSQKGKIVPVTGGSQIFQEFQFQSNGNANWYSGFDQLPVAAQDVISGAAFAFKQCACAVVISGLELLQNAGKEQMINLLDARISNAEASMMNLISQGIYSDGTGSGGKIVTGLGAAVVALPTSGTYGGIDRNTWSFWRNQYTGSLGTQNAGTIQANMNSLWAKCTRGKDMPDLVVFDNQNWAAYMASLQALQRFTGTSNEAVLGFPSVKYMTADVVLDGGIGGFEATGIGHFLNTNYLHWRPHQDRNMVPLNPSRRYAVNQDAEVQILAWAGNLTCSGAQFQGYFQGT